MWCGPTWTSGQRKKTQRNTVSGFKYSAVLKDICCSFLGLCCSDSGCRSLKHQRNKFYALQLGFIMTVCLYGADLVSQLHLLTVSVDEKHLLYGKHVNKRRLNEEHTSRSLTSWQGDTRGAWVEPLSHDYNPSSYLFFNIIYIFSKNIKIICYLIMSLFLIFHKNFLFSRNTNTHKPSCEAFVRSVKCWVDKKKNCKPDQKSTFKSFGASCNCRVKSQEPERWRGEEL